MKRLKFGSLFVSLSLIKTFRDKFIIVLFSLCLINATVCLCRQAFAGAWEELDGSATGGGVSNNAGISNSPSLALDSSGNPHIAWHDSSSGNDEIYYAYWNGTNWVTHGGANTGGGVSNNAGNSFGLLSLALDSSGYPHIAWDDSSSGSYEIYYAYWNGTNWVTHGGANTGGGVSNNAGYSFSPSLALDSSGNPHIAWMDGSGGNWEIYYAYWDGFSWMTYGGGNTGGGVSNNGGYSEYPSLALDSSGNPHIAWIDGSDGIDSEIYYAYWDGSNWVTHGEANTGGGVSNDAVTSVSPSLALDNSGNPHIAWSWYDFSVDDLYYTYWDGTQWTTYGSAIMGSGVSDNGGNSLYPSLALDTNGNPHIAWRGNSIFNFDIYYAYWDGFSWATYEGANTGGGVSNNTGASGVPSLALDTSGNPHIAWGDTSGGDIEIYYRYWNPLGGITTTTTTSTSTTSTTTTTTTTSMTTTTTTTSTTTTTFVCWCPADGFMACVSGQVTDSEGEPLAEKKVWFKGRLFPGGPSFTMKTRTDDNGCYKFTLPEGIGKIWVKRCRGEGKKDVSVPFGEKVNGVDFECKKRRR